MSDLSLPQSPSPSKVGFALPRRSMIKGAAGVASLAAFPALLAACGSDSDGAVADGGTDTTTAGAGGFELGAGSGDLSIGSNYSNDQVKDALAATIAALPNKDIVPAVNTTDHNTYQENISTYLQNPDDVLPWFAGFRMQFFAAQGLVGDISDVWAAGLDNELSSGFKTASTGLDGKQYFVPFNYYAWGVYYRKSLFEENGWTPPTNMEELTTLATEMQAAGLTPFAFANSGNWPAMGTFDQLNVRINGYQFHVDLMAGRESWTDDRVKEVFATWETLLPFHSENPNGREWEEAAAAIVNKEAGMMTIGTFIGSQFPEGELDDLDFFPFPEINPDYGTEVVEAPIDGFMMAASPKNEQAAKELLYFIGTGAGQDAYLAVDPSVVAPAESVDSSVWSDLQNKVFDTVQNAKFVTQFLDRDTSPEFASNVAGPRIADFLADPSQIDSILEDMQAQAGVMLGDG